MNNKITMLLGYLGVRWSVSSNFYKSLMSMMLMQIQRPFCLWS